MSSSETLVMENNLREIPRMAGFVGRFGETHRFSHGDTFALTLAIEELLTNTVNYGYPEGGRHELLLELSLEDGACRAVLSDDGLPFNPLDRPEVDTSLSLEEKPVGGLGIHLVKKMMTRVEYAHREGRNILTLHRKLGSEDGPPAQTGP